MHFRHSGIAVVLAALALPLAVAGCVVEQPRPVAEIVAPRRPPPPRVEVIPPAPRAAEFVVWRPGHWQWARGEFVWVSGAWVERPRRAARWVPGHWDERPNGAWVWVAGHWR